MREAIGNTGEAVAREGSALADAVGRQQITLALFEVLSGTPRIYAGMPVPEAVGGSAQIFARHPESSLARLANGLLGQVGVAAVMAAAPPLPAKKGTPPKPSVKGGL